MSTWDLSAAYHAIAELLLHPEQRDTARIEASLKRLGCAPLIVTEPLEAFVSDPATVSGEEYVRTLELAPPCPLYLGAYLFDEPNTCRDVGVSGRNGYMLELSGVYRHFGLEIDGGELPDFVPLMVEFLGISLERSARDRMGLRRRFLERYLVPGLAPLRDALAAQQSPYALLVTALEAVAEEDMRRITQTPGGGPPERQRRTLPVLASPPAGGSGTGG